ncbi:type VII secretion protein EccB [Mycolicibacterium llatzerense]|uniref:type VII secretion protein EccB n=1 Tax=Mycolicibacterium llatzerense TaxID=280871 RepID=UPI0008DDBAE9|nr:type VII secretion protein EccB [Mycolicibacterium llatzerense]
MARFSTTKVQLSGYRLLVRQIEQAFSSRTTMMLRSPLSSQTLTFIVGFFLACLVPAVGFFVSYMSPKANRNDAEMVMTKSGGYYVMFDGALHPVTNLASARLIVGKPDQPKIVKDDSLTSDDRGKLMGVPSGPNNLATRPDDTAKWSVCDKHTDDSDLSLTKTDSLSTTLFAGTDSMSPAVSALLPNDAVVVKRPAGPDQLWLVRAGTRVAVGTQDMATRAALGLTPEVAAAAIPISDGLFNALPAAPALTTPYIANRGQVNPALPQLLNGDIIITSAVDGTRKYQVALDDGVQAINEFVAQLLVNTGSKEVTTLDRSTVAAAPLSSNIDLTRYPDHAPIYRAPHVLCWTWQRGIKDLRATESVLTGEALPIIEGRAGKPVELLKSTGTGTTASASVTKPGLGWFVRVTGVDPTSHAQEQLLWIDDTGVRYFIGVDDQGKYDSTVKALGIGGHEPLPIPWSIAKLYAPGSTLSQQAARTYHQLLPDDMNQKAIPMTTPPPASADQAPAG